MAVSIVDSVTSIISLLDCLENLPTQPPSLYLDIEGVRLSRHGSISIIQVLVFPLNHVFLIDIHVLQDSAFCTPNLSGSTLKSVLESDLVPKVFFDVRNDADALFAHFQICMQGVQDIQLLELASRSYPKHRVSGLGACIENDVQLAAEAKEAWKITKESGMALFATECGGSYEVFNVRPMWQEIIDYCTNDVVYLPVLWNIYSQKVSSGWAVKVEVETRKRLLGSQSVSYNPHGKDKILSPWARPVKSGKSNHFDSRAKHDPKLLGSKQQSPAELVAMKSVLAKGKKQPGANLVHQAQIGYMNLGGPSQEAHSNSLVKAQYANRTFEHPTLQSNFAISSSASSSQKGPIPPDPSLHASGLPSTWICSTCDRMMQEDQKQAHLDGKNHTERLKQAQDATSTSSNITNNALDIDTSFEHALVLPDLALRSKLASVQKPPIIVKSPPHPAILPSSWTCEICSRAMQPDQKQAHLIGQKHTARLKQVQTTSATSVQTTTTVPAKNSPQTATIAAPNSRKAKTTKTQNVGSASPVKPTTTASANVAQAATAATKSSPKRAKTKTKLRTKSSHHTASTSQELGQPYPDWGFVGFGGGSYGRPKSSYDYGSSMGAGDYSICDKDCGWCGNCMDRVGVDWDD